MVIFPISIFSQIRSEGGGHQISFFSQIQNSPHYPRGGGHENYGLFPQFGTFSFWHAPLINLSSASKLMMLLCDKIGPCCNNWGKISHTSPPNGSYLSNNVSLNLSKRLLAILKPLSGGVTKITP